MPSTRQVTARLAVLETVAVKAWVWIVETVALAGVTATDTAGAPVGGPLGGGGPGGGGPAGGPPAGGPPAGGGGDGFGASLLPFPPPHPAKTATNSPATTHDGRQT